MFLIGLLALALLPAYWRLLPRGWRRPLFCMAGAAVLASIAPLSLSVLLVLCTAVWLLLLAPARASLAALATLAALCSDKLLAAPSGQVVGLSYAAFRLVHVAVDVGRGRLARPPLPRLLEYALFPPAFLSGPIDRLPSFAAGVRDAALPLDDLVFGLRRILFGLAKKLYLVTPLQAFADPAFARAQQLSAGEAWAALGALFAVIYLDFSAYCDIAIGVARLFGYTLPENFSWPWLAADISEFWQRWHATLSTFLRDYVQLPLGVSLARVPALRRRPLLAYSASVCVTMLLCGLWHGATASFAAWGLGHGLLLAAHRVFREKALGRLPARRRQALARSPAWRAAATATTLLSVSLLWPLFRLAPAAAGRFVLRLFGLG
jgi:alginate O-acetyltransferase complex protein AlgI